MNKVILIGRLGADPETKDTQSGTLVCKFRIATDRRGKDGTDWHRITTFGKTAGVCAKFLSKGRMVAVEGRIQYSQYQEKWFTDIIANDVRFLDGQDGGARPTQGPKPGEGAPLPDGVEFPNGMDIPF